MSNVLINGIEYIPASESPNYEYEKQKLYDFLGDSIVKLFKEHKVYVAGGAITSLFCNRDINDIDVYFKSQDMMIGFYEDIWGSSKWITYHTRKSSIFKHGDTNIQLIHFDTFPKTEDIFNKFDFTICMAAFDFETEQFILHPDFLKHNSQRVLRFNKHTAFPIVSVLRLHKYKEKGYNISRFETMKMLFCCANLNITSYDELFDQSMAMSDGENLEDVIDTSKPFSMEEVLKQIEQNAGKGEYSNSSSVPFEDLDDLLKSITSDEYKPKYLKIKNNLFKVINNDKLIKSECGKVADEYLLNVEEFFKDYKFYKFVKKTSDGKYYSFYDKNFEYKLGEEIVPANGNSGAIWCAVRNKLDNCTYNRSNENSVAIELQIEGLDDIKEFSSLAGVKLSKCKFIRELAKEEYDKDDDNDEDDVF